MRAYFLPGLGVDRRLYQNQIGAGIELIILEWILPLHNETIESYALRMCDKIKNKENIILGGVSFGGFIAVEMAKIISPRKIILISTAKSRNEFPLYIKLTRFLKLNTILPDFIFNYPGITAKIIHPLFGRLNKENKNIFFDMMNSTNPMFLKWAIDKAVNWNNKTIPKNIIHIHGSFDHIFPIRNIRSPRIIKGGDHLMILTKSEEINTILKTELL